MARLLIQEHGLVLPASTTAKLLGYRTDALRQARIRKLLPISMFEIEGRRGWFASTREVANWIDCIFETGQRVVPVVRRHAVNNSSLPAAWYAPTSTEVEKGSL
jgi:hypothetical protein